MGTDLYSGFPVEGRSVMGGWRGGDQPLTGVSWLPCTRLPARICPPLTHPGLLLVRLLTRLLIGCLGRLTGEEAPSLCWRSKERGKASEFGY